MSKTLVVGLYQQAFLVTDAHMPMWVSSQQQHSRITVEQMIAMKSTYLKYFMQKCNGFWTSLGKLGFLKPKSQKSCIGS